MFTWNSYIAPWVYTLFFLVYAATIISCIVVVLSEKRNPIRSLAWVIALVFLPYVGWIFYIFFGRSFKSKRMISRHNKRKLLSRQPQTPREPYPDGLTPESMQLIKLASSMSRSQPMTVSALRIYTNGVRKFEDLKRDLSDAKHSINLQYYIFSDDALGQEIAAILMDKARKGVKVRVMYDHVGSFSARRRFFGKMRRAGVEAHPFFRVTFPQLANRINWRNHRKIVVIDDHIGYIGGMNIASRYVEGSSKHKVWRDTHLRVEGPIVASMLYSFSVDWNFLKHHCDITPIRPIPEPTEPETCFPAQLLTSGPTDRWASIALLFQRAILSARKCVYIQTPYFLPTEVLLNALQTAALSKVDVRVMIPERSDSNLLRLASYSYVTECLQAGIKVYLYKPGMLHAKTLIIDDEFSSVGSTNFDFRSFEQNFEGNLLLYDKQTNHDLKQQFFDDIRESVKLTYSIWTQRPRTIRFWESIVRLLSPIL